MNVNIGFIKSNGFGNQDKTLTETKDCTVRAISLFFNVDYNIAHEVCKKYGRKEGHGFNYYQFKKVIAYFKRHLNLHASQGTRSGNVQGLVNKYHDKIVLVSINRHVFVIKQGIILDTFKPSPFKHVLNSWVREPKE